jgi:acylphosphatase
MERVNVAVNGTVQGVGYRYGMRQAAMQHGVSGWVRNRADGSVHAELEGEPAALEAVLAWARKGPSGARVTGIEVTEVPTTGETGFDVRSTA